MSTFINLVYCVYDTIQLVLAAGNSAAKMARNVHSVYGEEYMNERTCRRWFAKFRSGDFTLEDADRTGHPVEFDDTLLEAALEENPSVGS